jgi:hypothetical protein
MRPSFAIVGSAQPRAPYDPAVRDHELAVQAAEELGFELARQDCDIFVYSSDPAFIESAVVRGYVRSGQARSKSIKVRGRYGRANDTGFVEALVHPDLFDIFPAATSDWEVSYYRSLLVVDGALLLGGGQSTFITGVIMISRRRPLVAVAAFGGGGEKAWHRLASEVSYATPDQVALMAQPWRKESAKQLVASLLAQHHESQAEQDRLRREDSRSRKRAALGALAGGSLLLGALSTIPVLYAWSNGTASTISALVAGPLLAATCGAVMRNSFDRQDEWLRIAVLGASAGAVAFLLFVAAQLTANPEILDGSGARRLIFFVLPIGFIAGLTFDAVYRKLRAQDVTQTSMLDQQ